MVELCGRCRQKAFQRGVQNHLVVLREDLASGLRLVEQPLERAVAAEGGPGGDFERFKRFEPAGEGGFEGFHGLKGGGQPGLAVAVALHHAALEFVFAAAFLVGHGVEALFEAVLAGAGDAGFSVGVAGLKARFGGVKDGVGAGLGPGQARGGLLGGGGMTLLLGVLAQAGVAEELLLARDTFGHGFFKAVEQAGGFDDPGQVTHSRS